MKTILCTLILCASTVLGQEPTLPVDREITDTSGRKLTGQIIAKSETGIKFRRASDGKEFDIPLDSLSAGDRIYLGIDPPDTLDSQRFPFRIHAPLRRHGNPNGGATTIEPGEPVEMLAQDGKTIRILHAGQELEFQIPEAGGETTAKPAVKSRWTPAFPSMATKKFLEAAETDEDGPDPEISRIWRQAVDKDAKDASNAKHNWYRKHRKPYAREWPMHIVITSTTLQPPGEAKKPIQIIQPTRAKTFPPELREDPAAAVGCLLLDYSLKAEKKPLLPQDAYLKGIQAQKGEIGWKTKFPLSLPELTNAYTKILPNPDPEFAPASFSALDSRRLAPIFPLNQHNEVIIERIKSDIRKQEYPVLISTIRWEGKAANGKDFGKAHTTLGFGYKSDGTIKGTSLQCLDGDGEIRDYPAEDVFAVWSIQFNFNPPKTRPNRVDPSDPNNLISGNSGEKRESLNITPNDTVLVTSNTGAEAVLQFTRIEPYNSAKTVGAVTISNASYRWKARAKPAAPIQSGTGELKASYTLVEKPNYGPVNVPNPDCNLIVKAGMISLAWSPNAENRSQINYYPSRGTVKVVPADTYEDFGKP